MTLVRHLRSSQPIGEPHRALDLLGGVRHLGPHRVQNHLAAQVHQVVRMVRHDRLVIELHLRQFEVTSIPNMCCSIASGFTRASQTLKLGTSTMADAIALGFVSPPALLVSLF